MSVLFGLLCSSVHVTSSCCFSVVDVILPLTLNAACIDPWFVPGLRFCLLFLLIYSSVTNLGLTPDYSPVCLMNLICSLVADLHYQTLSCAYPAPTPADLSSSLAPVLLPVFFSPAISAFQMHTGTFQRETCATLCSCILPITLPSTPEPGTLQVGKQT